MLHSFIVELQAFVWIEQVLQHVSRWVMIHCKHLLLDISVPSELFRLLGALLGVRRHRRVETICCSLAIASSLLLLLLRRDNVRRNGLDGQSTWLLSLITRLRQQLVLVLSIEAGGLDV